MIRRTVAFTNTLNQRLKLLAQEGDKKFSTVVRQLLEKALQAEEDTRITRMYQDLEKLRGVGSPDITDASTTINEVLYGESGAGMVT